jgi:hypothetical protein
MTVEPDWLTWTRELQAIAQTGLAFARDPYDRERYEMLRFLASKMMAAHTAAPVERIEALFENETGYATPKVDVRGAVFDDPATACSWCVNWQTADVGRCREVGRT